jgi:hypothetical protein
MCETIRLPRLLRSSRGPPDETPLGQSEDALPSFFEPDVSRDRVIATRLGFLIAVICALVTIAALCRWLQWW